MLHLIFSSRYIVTWFREFSEYEKSDFMAILIQWLLKNSEVCVNGVKDESESIGLSENGRPLSIFLCRVSFIFIQNMTGYHITNSSHTLMLRCLFTHCR